MHRLRRHLKPRRQRSRPELIEALATGMAGPGDQLRAHDGGVA
jgi:hypothetical protein